MNAVTVKDAKRNLDKLISKVIADADATIVVGKKGKQVVVLSLDEYNSWKETLHLLSSPENAKRLRESIKQVKRGQVKARELVDA